MAALRPSCSVAPKPTQHLPKLYILRPTRRRFRDQVGTTPAVWLTRARTRRAQRLLEWTALSVERVAAEVGFGSPAVLRAHFGQIVGTSPLAYRRAFQAS